MIRRKIIKKSIALLFANLMLVQPVLVTAEILSYKTDISELNDEYIDDDENNVDLFSYPDTILQEGPAESEYDNIEENVNVNNQEVFEADDIGEMDISGEHNNPDISVFDDEYTVFEDDIVFSSAEDSETQYTLEIEQRLTDSSDVDSANVGISMFSLASFSGNYGNQLEGLAREFYDYYVDNYATNQKTGSYEYELKTPLTFKAEISNGVVIQNDALKEQTKKIDIACQVAVDAFLYDHPEVFWFAPGTTSSSIVVSGSSSDNMTGKISKVTFKPAEKYSGAASLLSNYNEAVKSVKNEISYTSSRYDTLKDIHDYICRNAYYDSADNSGASHSSGAFFVGSKGLVCEGYAKAFKVLCDEFNIPCVCVGGIADTSTLNNKPHMWNYVQMDDGAWYLVDTTWDDQESKIYDTYFLAGWSSDGFYEKVSEERVEKTDFSSTGYMNFVYPVLSNESYIPSVKTIKLDFQWGRDNFSFNNSAESFGTDVNTKYDVDEAIDNTYFINTDKFKMKQHMEKWRGCCYGMSTMALQLFVGDISLSSLQSGAKSTYGLKKPSANQSLKNMIGLYQSSCSTSRYVNAKYDFLENSENEKIKFLYDKMCNIEKTGVPVLVEYAWVADPEKASSDQDGGWAAHAVLAYALETEGGPYKYGGKTYVYKVRVIDPNTIYNGSTNMEDANNDCIYLTKELDSCCIPKSNTIADSSETYFLKTISGAGDEYGEMKLQLVSDDKEILPPTTSDVQICDNVFTLGSVLSIDGHIINGFNGSYQGVVSKALVPAGNTAMLNVALDRGEHSVEFLDDAQNIGIISSDSCNYVTASPGSTVTFGTDNGMNINNNEEPFKIVSIDNSVNNEGIDNIVISGEGTRKLNIIRDGSEITLTGDSLSGITISNEQGESYIIDTDKKVISVQTSENGVIEIGKSVNDENISVVIENQIYTGELLRPEVKVFDKETQLTEGKDYLIDYGSNVNIGDAFIIINGIGNYNGTRKVHFRIVEKEHLWNEGVVTKAATCASTGIKTYTCSVCNTTKCETIEKNSNHRWSAWKTISGPTVFAARKQQHTCSVCGIAETRNTGSKLSPLLSLNASSLKLKAGQSTKAFKVKKMAKGDYVSGVKSGNTKIVKITKWSKTGTIVLSARKKVGKAKITVKLASGIKKTVTVSVQKSAVRTTKISGLPSKITLKKRMTRVLKPTILPITSSDKITYKSSDKGIATVNKKGVITAKKAGTARITVTSGKKKFVVLVIVKK